VIRDMAGQGNKLIFGTTFGYMEPMLKVAADSKDVKFEHATGYKTADNMRTYDSRTYEGAYMAGVIAGKMTKTNTLGVVGSMPIPEVIRNINSFTLGAQSVNPKIKTKVVWVNEWFNPPKETEAATSLINGGADVLMQNTDSSAVLQTAEKMGKRAFGWDSDMTAYGPKAHLGSAVINWGPYYIKAVGRAQWQVDHRPGLVGREGRRHRHGVGCRRRAGRRQEEGRRNEGRPEGRQLRDLEGPDHGQHWQGSAGQGRRG
jgi:basic membrane protein A